MLQASAGLERQCPGTEELKVAAIINWYGITDVNDLLDGANMKTYAVQWLSSMQNRDEIATGVPNQLLTIPGGKHGGFSREESSKIFATIREFLNKNGVTNNLQSSR